MLHSVACICSGIDLNGGTLGIAPLGTMCSGRRSSGLVQDTGSSVAFLASTAAHELGHILNMDHDDGRKYLRLYILKWSIYHLHESIPIICNV